MAEKGQEGERSEQISFAACQTRWCHSLPVPVDESQEEPQDYLSDIFAFANHLAWQVGGPITIEDPSWRIIAYSTIHQRIDEARRRTILRHEVPPEYQTLVEQHRVAQRFLAGDSVVEIPADAELAFARRIAVPVKIQGFVVGSIWVAESNSDLSPDALKILQAAKEPASYFFRVQSDARRRESEIFLTMLLDGVDDDIFLASYFGFQADSILRVLSVWHGGDALLRELVIRVAGVTSRTEGLEILTLTVGDQTYMVAYMLRANHTFEACMNKVVSGVSAVSETIVLGLGGAATRLQDIPKSRKEADLVVTYLRHQTAKRVAEIDSVRTGVSLMQVAEVLRAQSSPILGKLQTVSKLEATDRKEAMNTLNLFFEHMGNAAEAARRLHLHPNSFRYRLAKISDILNVDLGDRETRQLLELQLLLAKYADLGEG